MQYKRLSVKQKKMRRWRMQRNKMVQKLLDQDKYLMRADAARQANKMMRKNK